MAQLVKIGEVHYSDIHFPVGRYSNGKVKYKRIRRALSADKEVAKDKLDDLLKELRARKHHHTPTQNTYQSAKSRFFSIYTTKSKITRRHYERALRNLENGLKIEELAHITPDSLVRLYRDWKASDRGLYVRNRDMECILTFVRRAEAWGMVKVRDWEPVVDIMDAEPRGRVHFYTPKEVKILKAKTYGVWRTMTMLGARAGLRPGEMYFLEWSDIDLGARKIHIDSKPAHGWNVKTYERRTIPISKDLRRYLVGIKKKDGWVLADESGKRPNSADVMSTYYSRRVRAAGLKGSIYTLRHSFASHLVQAGVMLQVVRDLLGHRTIQTTEIYSHLIPKLHQDAVDRLPDV